MKLSSQQLKNLMVKYMADTIRMDGRLERTCEHGVGHPVGSAGKWEGWMEVHGCDGCCSKWEKHDDTESTA